MNSCQRMQARLRGDPADYTPNFDIIMVFGVHHIGEQLSSYYRDHRVLVRANLAMIEDFGLDIVQAISDPYREAVDFGLAVEFPEDSIPLCKQPLLIEPGDLVRLKPPDPFGGGRMTDRLEAIRLFRQQVGGEVPVMGWVEGALAEASDLRGASALLTDFYDRSDWLLELLELCCQVEIAFARAQVAAGADIIGLGDAIASQISPRLYQKYALPYEQRIFAAVHEMGALGRLHICGDTTRLLPWMRQSGADLIDIDWMVDIRQAADIFADGPALCGNFNPVEVMYRGTPEQVRQAVLECQALGGAKYFSAAGCEIPDGTPPENLRAQMRALRERQQNG